MANEPYKNRDQMYFWYVTKRLKLTQIQKILNESYGIKISPQALYNHAKAMDLLKYRGKGRNLKPGQKRAISPVAQQMARVRQEQKARQKKRH